MLFQNEEASLKLEITSYEVPNASGFDSYARNWLVLRCTWVNEEGELRKDSNSCLQTYELRELTAGLKVLCADIRDSFVSDFASPYFELAAESLGTDAVRIAVSFFLPNTMDGDDTAEVTCVMTRAELKELIEELDALCEKFPERT